MDQSTQALALVITAAIGIVAVLAILRRERRREASAAEESPFAVSTEGMKRCPACGFGNLVTDTDCASCGAPLPG
jgi:hypothetical protein